MMRMRVLSLLLIVGLALLRSPEAEARRNRHHHHLEEHAIDGTCAAPELAHSSEKHHIDTSRLMHILHHLSRDSSSSSSSEECEITTPCIVPTETPVETTTEPPTTEPPSTTDTPVAENDVGPRNLDVIPTCAPPVPSCEINTKELLHHLLEQHSNSESSMSSEDSSSCLDDYENDSVDHAIHHILAELVNDHGGCCKKPNVVIKNTLVADKCCKKQSSKSDDDDDDESETESPACDSDDTYEYEDIFSTTVAAAPSNIKEVIQKFPGKRDIVKMKEDHVTSSYVSQQKAKVQRIFEVMKTMETRDLEDKNVMVDGAWQFVENIFDEMEGRHLGGV